MPAAQPQKSTIVLCLRNLASAKSWLCCIPLATGRSSNALDTWSSLTWNLGRREDAVPGLRQSYVKTNCVFGVCLHVNYCLSSVKRERNCPGVSGLLQAVKSEDDLGNGQSRDSAH
jgi:hypothetical protein